MIRAITSLKPNYNASVNFSSASSEVAKAVKKAAPRERTTIDVMIALSKKKIFDEKGRNLLFDRVSEARKAAAGR